MSVGTEVDLGLVKGLDVEQEFVHTIPGVTLRLLRIPCAQATADGRILFVPGWMSFSDTWRLVLRELRRRFEVYYVESREKNSSTVSRRTRCRIEDLVHDYRVIAEYLRVEDGDLNVVASSVGAATVIRGFSAGVRPRCIATISPILRPEIPAFTPYMVMILRGPLVRLARWLTSWWYGYFIYRVSRDEFQRSRFLQVLKGCDPRKMARGARDLVGLDIPMSEVEALDVPVLILAASQDPQHRADDIEAMSHALPHSRYVDLEFFQRTHSPTAGQIIAAFLIEGSVASSAHPRESFFAEPVGRAPMRSPDSQPPSLE
jgi:pimeloyl-ACP methyl ester carboxylesterase